MSRHYDVCLAVALVVEVAWVVRPVLRIGPERTILRIIVRVVCDEGFEFEIVAPAPLTTAD